jgi:hypothetical protein
MSLPATVIVGVLAAWALASFCFAIRVPRVHEALKRINWFRTFAHWTMFAANPNPKIRPGSFVVLYRDEPGGEWLCAIDGHHWASHSFLLNPRRMLAARAHHIGQFFAAVRGDVSDPALEAERRNREDIVASYLRRTRPLRVGQTRTVRVVKRFGRAAATDEELAWEFTIRE